MDIEWQGTNTKEVKAEGRLCRKQMLTAKEKRKKG